MANHGSRLGRVLSFVIDFEDFARCELDGLLRYATVLTGDREPARDLVQDVMFKAYRQWATAAVRSSA